jgi:hypothetical protein
MANANFHLFSAKRRSKKRRLIARGNGSFI